MHIHYSIPLTLLIIGFGVYLFGPTEKMRIQAKQTIIEIHKTNQGVVPVPEEEVNKLPLPIQDKERQTTELNVQVQTDQ